MDKNFELKKESGIFEKDIRVGGFSSTRGIKYWDLSGLPSASPAGKTLIG